MNIEKLILEIENINAQIYLLQKPINDKVFELNQKKKEIEEKLDKAVYELARPELSINDYGCGTVNDETANFKIKTVVSKSVKWDEDQLKQIANVIKSSGKDPETYIKYKLSVSETDYKKFPDDVRDFFEPARTVEASKPKITWERK